MCVIVYKDSENKSLFLHTKVVELFVIHVVIQYKVKTLSKDIFFFTQLVVHAIVVHLFVEYRHLKISFVHTMAYFGNKMSTLIHTVIQLFMIHVNKINKWCLTQSYHMS